MTKLSKRMKSISGTVDTNQAYTFADAVKTLSDNSKVKFVETVDVSINLGIDPRKSDQMVRGSVVLPKGTGKTVRVAVFAEGENADKAKAAGADIVGFDDLADEITAGKFDFDVLIATPNAMKVVGKLGPVLGPKGLMPNPKDGTVSPDVEAAVKSAKAGQVRFRSDKAGIVHCPIGKLNFQVDDLETNFKALMEAINKLKPTSAKGVYLRKVTVSSTMGPGLKCDLSSIN